MISFREYAEGWKDRQLWRESTAARLESVLRCHIFPAIGAMPLIAVRPSDLDIMVKKLTGILAPSTVEGVYRLVATVFKSAVRNRIITTTPCVDVKLPEKPRREVVPLAVEQVADLAVGVTVDRVDFLRRTVTVDRQLVTPPRGEPRFGPVKRAASNRVVPLPAVVADALALHI